jgi:hypothetical protein
MKLHGAGKQLLWISLVLLALVLLIRVVPQREPLYALAPFVVLSAAFVVGVRLTLSGNQAFIAWMLSCAVAPSYFVLMALIVPDKPGSFADLAYIFGSIYGAMSGGAGVLLGLAIRRRKTSGKEPPDANQMKKN